MDSAKLEGLKQHLGANKQIKTVYLKGDDWVFIKRDEYTAKTRDEILAMEGKETITAAPASVTKETADQAAKTSEGDVQKPLKGK